MLSPYHETITLIERLHRQFLEVLKVELERSSIQDINNVQSLILYNVGDDELTVGELTARGYYLGSNVSYNLKKLVENGYLLQERSIHDKRSIRVRLSDKGKALHTSMTDLYAKHIENMENTSLSIERIGELNAALKDLEGFWGTQMGVGGLTTELVTE